MSILNDNEPVTQALPGKRGQGWKVQESGGDHGWCQPRKREMAVPLEGSCVHCHENHNFAIRRHEMAHAAWTPTNFDAQISKWQQENGLALDNQLFQVVEDMRMGVLLNHANVTMPPLRCYHANEVTALTATMKASTLRTRVLTAVQLYAYRSDHPIFPILRDAAPPHEPPLIPYQLADLVHNTLTHRPNGAGRINHVDRPNFQDTLRATKLLHDLLNVQATKAEKERQKAQAEAAEAERQKRLAEQAEKEAEEQARQSGNSNAQEAQNLKEQVSKAVKPQLRNGQATTGSIWAPMTINDLPKPDRLPGRLTSRIRNFDQGRFIRNVNRHWSDGKIFGHKLRRPGGSILLDMSGSMSWNIDDIWKILMSCPGATIAGYSGSYVGELRIFARSGNICKASDVIALYGGNEVDGPALEWLIEQERPRIYVGDGGVHAPRGTSQQAMKARDLYIRLGHIAWLTPQRLAGVHGTNPPVAQDDCGKGDQLTDAIIKHLRLGGAHHVPR